jgi:hypothetical protein
LAKTSGVIDYVIAKGLYMIPSNMILNKLGESVAGFNDKAVLAKGLVKEGYVKPKPVIPEPVVTKPTANEVKPPPPASLPQTPATILTRIPREVERSDTHSGSKLAIIGGVVFGGILFKKFIL